MNIFNLNNNEPNEEIRKIQMDLEAPLLQLENDDNENYNENYSKRCSNKIAEIHSAIPCINGSTTTFHHISEPCQGFSTVNTKMKKKKSKAEADDDSDDDDDDSETHVIDAQCNIINRTYFCGFILGLILQACSLYVVGMVLPTATVNIDGSDFNGNAGMTTTTIISNKYNLSGPAVFALFFFSRYWVLGALLLPPTVCAMRQKMMNRRRRHRSASIINNSNKNDNDTKGQNNINNNKQFKPTKKSASKLCLESVVECVRFQFGLFFGSLILLSAVNFYALARTAPLCMLLAYYGACVVVSFLALLLLQSFVNQVCANVSSVEIIVSYDKDDDDDEDDDDEE